MHPPIHRYLAELQACVIDSWGQVTSLESAEGAWEPSEPPRSSHGPDFTGSLDCETWIPSAPIALTVNLTLPIAKLESMASGLVPGIK